MNTDTIVYYFDGKTATPHSVYLSLEDECIKIHFLDSSEFLIWPLKDCRFENFNSNKKITISYGSFPKQQIQLSAEEYADIYKALNNKHNPLFQLYQKLTEKTNWKIITAGLAIILGISWFYIRFLSPWVGERAVVLIPKEAEIEIGKRSLSNIISFTETHSNKTKLLNEFYERCCFSSEYPVQLHYINSDQVNAFAAPGGQIVVFDGIIDQMDCYDELAGLMAHELAHVNRRHGMKNLARSISAYLILSALTGDVAGISGIFMEQEANFQSLANSREDELEADSDGLKYLENNEIGSQGMLALMKTIQNYQNNLLDSLSLPKTLVDIDFLSTHPATEKRVYLLQESLDAKPYYSNYRTDLDSLFNLIKLN